MTYSLIVFYRLNGVEHIARVATGNANFAGDAIRKAHPAAVITAILGTRLATKGFTRGASPCARGLRVATGQAGSRSGLTPLGGGTLAR